MRYDKVIEFVTVGNKEFNYDTGNNEQLTPPTSDIRWGNVSSQSMEVMKLLYGGLRERSAIVRLQNNFGDTFDYIVIDEVRYQVDREVKHRRDHVFYVSELL